MNSVKTSSAVTVVIALLLSVVSCKKDHDSASTNTVTKDQLVGKWNLFIQSDAGNISAQATMKGSGAMELDEQPYDGITDLVLLWDVNNNKFTAHVDAFGVTNYWKLDGAVDPKTLAIAGQLTTNTSPPVNAIFTLDKQ
ncbi:MAG TPA: hypothetical protein VGQ53_04170 [Chitinophagaceae bacterium]|jgi:hypothetical protein|nr:hypothetical protein [Chitinophagaceae bacterium]